MKYLRHLTVLAISAAVMLGIAVPAASAIAPGYEQFAGCPTTSTVSLCLRSETNGGSIIIGNTNTPINKQIVFSGGIDGVTGKFVYNGSGGLNAPPLNVPGGLTGLTGLSEFVLNLITFGANQVQAQAILVGTPTLGLGDKIDLTLPVRIKLINPFLNSNCSLGSTSSPVNLAVTSGTTSPPPPTAPLTGVTAPFGSDPKLAGVLTSTGNVLVGNAFSVPTATGCDLLGFGLINSLVNARVGLPSAAGKNSATFSNTTMKLASHSTVYP